MQYISAIAVIRINNSSFRALHGISPRNGQHHIELNKAGVEEGLLRFTGLELADDAATLQEDIDLPLPLSACNWIGVDQRNLILRRLGDRKKRGGNWQIPRISPDSDDRHPILNPTPLENMSEDYCTEGAGDCQPNGQYCTQFYHLDEYLLIIRDVGGRFHLRYIQHAEAEEKLPEDILQEIRESERDGWMDVIEYEIFKAHTSGGGENYTTESGHPIIAFVKKEVDENLDQYIYTILAGSHIRLKPGEPEAEEYLDKRNIFVRGERIRAIEHWKGLRVLDLISTLPETDGELAILRENVRCNSPTAAANFIDMGSIDGRFSLRHCIDGSKILEAGVPDPAEEE